MFTGIIEGQAVVEDIHSQKTNRIFLLRSELAKEFRVDESIAHNGVCLTVERVQTETGQYQVTAIAETLSKTMLGELRMGDRLNLERALRADARLDGHFVQGHVDTVGSVCDIEDRDGSTDYSISYPSEFEPLVIDRGSICVNGISLTVARCHPKEHILTVSIIPHTMKFTNMGTLQKGTKVNLEFDMLGKYVQKLYQLKNA